METHTPNPTFELAETFFSIASTLSPEQTLYLARHKELLEKWIAKIKPTWISDQVSETFMEAKLEMPLEKILCHPRAVGTTSDGNADLAPICASIPEGVLYEYKLNCNLFPDELVECLGGQEFLKRSLCGLQHIRSLVAKQYRDKKGLLNERRQSYFPILNKQGKVCFATVWETDQKPPAQFKGVHKWAFYIVRKDKFIHEKSQLFLFQEKEEQPH